MSFYSLIGDVVEIEQDALICNEYTTLVVGWLEANPWG